MQSLWGFIQNEAAGQAEALGLSEWEYSSIMGASRQNVWDFTLRFAEAYTQEGSDKDMSFLTQNPEGIRLLFTVGWNEFRSLNPVFGKLSGFGTKPSGGSGRGASGPSAQDIRNRYDIDELAQGADSIWRNMLMDTPKSSRSIAKGYVDEMVRTKGEKRIDFVAYVRKRAMETNRFSVLYTNKPDSIEPEAYLARYAGVAAQVLAPKNVEEAATGGARIGADAASFGAKLARSDEVTGSAPFINGLENRMRNLSKVFRG